MIVSFFYVFLMSEKIFLCILSEITFQGEAPYGHSNKAGIFDKQFNGVF